MTDEPERLDNPNQQVVRPDGSGPADEGDGGSAPKAAPKAAAATREPAKGSGARDPKKG